jgi:predicted amidohydrolase YtcJ
MSFIKMVSFITVDNDCYGYRYGSKDGKIFAIGSQGDIDALNLKADTIIDLAGQFVYPGLIDAHCHFFRLGQQLQNVDLVGTKS